MISHFTNGSFGLRRMIRTSLLIPKALNWKHFVKIPIKLYTRYGGRYGMNGHNQCSRVKMADLQEYPKQIPTVFLLALHGEDEWCESQ